MKLAVLHLDLAIGPKQRNQKLLLDGVEKAVEMGAQVVITPETAWEGYFFYTLDPKAVIPPHAKVDLLLFQNMAKAKGVYIILGGVEKEGEAGKAYNSVFVIGKDGELMGTHRKNHSHQTGSEGWMELGTETKTFTFDSLRVSPLVCADAYYEDTVTAAKAGNPDVVTVSAAWPAGSCCPDPGSIWERASLWSGTPVVIANQTGNHCTMDMTIAMSAVVEDGKMKFSYSGKPAILLFDFDETKKRISSKDWVVMEV